jgi:hypothetical protein
MCLMTFEYRPDDVYVVRCVGVAGELKALRWLDVSGQGLSTLPRTFGQLKALDTLNLGAYTLMVHLPFVSEDEVCISQAVLIFSAYSTLPHKGHSSPHSNTQPYIHT